MTKISSARFDLEGGRLDNAVLKRYGETLVGGASGTNTGSAYTVNVANGNAFFLILNADCTFTFSNPSASGTACYFTLILKQDSTGGRLAYWPGTVAWSGDVLPILSTGASTYDVFAFLTTNGGSTWWGFPSGASYV